MASNGSKFGVKQQLQSLFRSNRRRTSSGGRDGPIASDWHYDVIKEAGRGEVRIIQRPAQENGLTLVAEVNDGPAAGAVRYRWFIVARPPS